MIGASSESRSVAVDGPPPPLARTDPARGASFWPPLTIAVIAFALLYPTLHWLEFNNSIENIVVETAVETRRDGHWLLPRMMGETRTRKPPIAAWLAAICIRPQTLAAMNDPATRDAACQSLATQARLPALAATCLMLAATYELGRLIGGGLMGLAAAGAAGTNLLLFNNGQLTTPDTHLALWVNVTNVFLLRAVLNRERWVGAVGAGISLGLAFMSKGPVALIFCLLPVVLWIAIRHGRRHSTSSGELATGKSWLMPVVAGIICFVLVASPWYALLWLRVPDVWRIWLNEVTRLDPADPRPDPWYASLRFFGLMFPWTPWLIAATVEGIVQLRRHQLTARLGIVLLLLWVPWLVLASFPERKARYMQPLVVPAGLAAAWGIARYAQSRSTDRTLEWIHWVSIGVVWIALPIVVGFFWNATTGQHWFPPVMTFASAAVGTLLLGLGIRLTRRRREALVWVSLLGMVLLEPLGRYGYSRDASGRADMKPLADAIFAAAPDARVFYVQARGDTVPLDLSIYLNRIVPTVRSLGAVPEGEGSTAIVLSRGKDEQLRGIDDSWRPVGDIQRGRLRWVAFVQK